MEQKQTGLTVKYRTRGVGTVWFKTGHVYTFRYLNYQNDPKPLIICINSVYGIYPRTKHKHNYVQGINFSYIPRNKRKDFIRVWLKMWDTTHGHAILSWKMIRKRFPYLQTAIRRYLLTGGMIRELKEIPYEEVEGAVIGSMVKDFSKRIIRARETGSSWLAPGLPVQQRYNK